MNVTDQVNLCTLLMKQLNEAVMNRHHEMLGGRRYNFDRVKGAGKYQIKADITCLRRQYGAILVKDDRIIATGYNGSARGEPNCCDVGSCWRKAHNIPHGQQYEKCVAVHAEDNAISQAGREAIGATLYIAGFQNGKPIEAVPCLMCARKIRNARIKEVVNGLPEVQGQGYRD